MLEMRTKGWSGYSSVTSIEPNGDGFYVSWEHCACGSSDDDSFELPLAYLFDDNWMELAERELEKEREAIRKQQEITIAKRKQKKEENERKQFAELQAKYGDA